MIFILHKNLCGSGLVNILILGCSGYLIPIFHCVSRMLVHIFKIKTEEPIIIFNVVERY